MSDFVVCLMGPTASGKTKLAMQLYDTGCFEIISVDSALVYRGINIGSGKPTEDELKKYPHHLVDILEPSKPFDVGQFCIQAKNLITQIHARQKIPLLVGGTMMYFHALQSGLANLPTCDATIRSQLLQRLQKEGALALYLQLQQCDPDYASKIKPSDTQRIQRALEVYLQTQVPLSEHIKKNHNNININIKYLNIALMPLTTPRSVLHHHIAIRFEQMLNQGFIEEVKVLYQRPDCHENLPAIRAVGYRQIWQYLQQKTDYTTMHAKALAATRQLAKRQLTWLRSWSKCHQLDFQSDSLVQQSLDLITHFN